MRDINAKRIVVKVGTNLLTDENNNLNAEAITEISRQICEMKDKGIDVILVSSGAISAGVGEMKLSVYPTEMAERQAMAAVGQSIVMHQYREAFNKFGYSVAQVLVTYETFMNEKTYENLRSSLSSLLNKNVVPVINENDAIATDEIAATFGDNDKLSSLVAINTDTDLLVILTDIDGLYDKNPKTHGDAVLIKSVPEMSPEIESLADGKGTEKSRGGMSTKLKGAKRCMAKGIEVIIASGKEENVLLRLMDGEDLGTYFSSKQ